MSEDWMPEFKQETRRWMFWFARIFGIKRSENLYYWRGKYWVTGEVENPFGKKIKNEGVE